VEIVAANLLSPIVLCFALGILATLLKSDLEVPPAVYQGLSLYLLLAIGLKGGAAVSETPFTELVGPLGMSLLLGVATPLSAYFLMRRFGRLNVVDSAAVAAHYGSVSAVTFLAALEATRAASMAAEGYLAALVAVMEVPGIFIGLVLARRKLAGAGGHAGAGTLKEAVHEVLTGRSILLLLGGLVIGAVCGAQKVDEVAPFFIAPFKGVLCLFLLELGMVAARRMRDLKEAGPRLLVLGCVLPLVHGLIGVAGGQLAGMSPGGAAVLGAMVGSASYIAAPAAVRIALPEASPGIYLTLALGVTFPFNLAVGIPIFLAASRWMAGAP